jgi:folylpolyglutamate synthase/dihydropteroate synthase
MSFPEQHLDALQAMADAWRQLNPSASPESIHTAHSVEQAIALADKFGPDCDIFVTGSLYLVGGVHAIFYE